MNADTITAICAVVVAVASLTVSITELRATRKHNRQSIRPLLGFISVRENGSTAGIKLYNAGLGPALITDTVLSLDGEQLGPWELETLNPLRAMFEPRPRFTSLRTGRFVQAGQSLTLLAVDEYEPSRDHAFWEMVRQRINLKVRYESLYGGEKFEVTYVGTSEQ